MKERGGDRGRAELSKGRSENKLEKEVYFDSLKRARGSGK